MNYGYEFIDVEEQNYNGNFIATVFTPAGVARIACDAVVPRENMIVFTRTNEHTVIAVIPQGMPYIVMETKHLRAVSEEEVFERQLDGESRARIFHNRREALRNGSNTDPFTNPDPSDF